MTTMLDLPDDLIGEILSRVPSESVRAARSTCKAWNASFYRRFTKKMEHSVKVTTEEARELGESRMIVMMDHNLYLTSIVLNENPSAKRLGKLTCLTHEQVKISQVFHCDGLLLCILKDDKRLVVWNPCSGETRWIEQEVQDANVQAKYKYALGYEKDSCRRHYKILRFTDARIRGFSSYETYDFGSSSWTHQRYNTFRGIDEFCDGGVSLKGNTYWCARDSWGLISHTVCFDFTRMRFVGLQYLPNVASYWSKYVVSLSCVRDEKLSVLIQPRETLVIDIWISNKIDHEQSVWWRKFLSVDMGTLTGLIRTDGGFFVEEEKKLAMVFGRDRDEKLDTVKVFGEDGYFKELDLAEPSDKECWPLVCPYVPSFVQIKPHKSSSEKR